MAAMGGASKVLGSMRKAKQEEIPALPSPSAGAPRKATIVDMRKQLPGANGSMPYNAAGYTTGKASASLTSTSADVNTRSDRALVDEEEWMFERILPGEKGYVAVQTNFGKLNIELFCDKVGFHFSISYSILQLRRSCVQAPKTCYNFLMLARDGKYDNTNFHRHIPGFMLQGGDPTGTGNGGSSYWGTDFRDEHALRNAYKHDSRGLLSMANRGANTNSSQFFFTFRATPHLNGKHTVFGKIVGGEDVLDKMEGVPTNPTNDRPTKQIKILAVDIYKDPYEEFKKKLTKKLAREQEDIQAAGANAKAREDREKDRIT